MTPRFTATLEPRSVPMSGSSMSAAYGLLALALFITLFGVAAGAFFALPILNSGWIFLLFLGEIALIVTAPSWSRQSPLKYVLFAAFPFLSGLTITPFLLSVVAGYVNGASILFNATIATVFLTLAAAVFARSTSMTIGATMGRFLFQSLIGLIVFGLLQMFIPALRGSGFEMIISGVGIVTFSLFLAFDMQRLAASSRYGASPCMLALSLYLDIFNLFLYVVRFMIALSGDRR